MMNRISGIFAALVFLMVFAPAVFGQICTSGLAHTSCFPWQTNDGYVDADPSPSTQDLKPNDTPRLNRAITATLGKLIFDEADYFLGESTTNSSLAKSLTVFSYRIFEGTGRSAGVNMSHTTSKLIQTKAGEPIFKIGPNVYEVSIRDMALVGRAFDENNKPDGTIGILAYSECLYNCTSLGFQFSNLKFSTLAKGIYVNANDPPTIPNNETSAHQWQFDNIRLDHAFFDFCTIGVHINSYNSGWNISSIDFLVPAGEEQGDDTSIENKTYGIYLERSTYTSMDLLIGNGPFSGAATALVYVKEHANLSIQSSIAEIFHDDIVIHGNTRNSPINLMNNTFMNGVRVSHATVFSTSNQYSALNSSGTPATAKNHAQIYSIGDKFCTEGWVCDEGRGFTLEEDSPSGPVTARVIFSTNQGKNFTTVPSTILRDVYDTNPNLSIMAPTVSTGSLLRLGRGSYWYDITRKEGGDWDVGYLEFQGNQTGYGGYTFKTQGGMVAVNYDGSVTYGSVSYSNLGSRADGTVVYCSNCTKSTPCNSGGSGALAKKLGGSWDCD